LSAELAVYKAQINEYKYEIGRLSREMNSTKQKYFDQKRREELAKKKDRANELELDRYSPETQKITGGGFLMTRHRSP